VMMYNCILALLIVVSAYLQNSQYSFLRIEHHKQYSEITANSTNMRIGFRVKTLYIMVLLVMFFHGLQPYFGASTMGVFSMYSNLQPYVTANGLQMNRHLFMPRAPSTLQGQHIKILESNSSTFLCANLQQDKPEIRLSLHEIGMSSTINYTPLMYLHQIAIGQTFDECHDYEKNVTLIFKPYIMTKSHFYRLISAKRSDDPPSFVKFQDMSTSKVHTLLHPPINQQGSMMSSNTRYENLLYTVPFFEEDPTSCYTA